MSMKIPTLERPIVRNLGHEPGYWFQSNRFTFLANSEDTENEYGMAHALVDRLGGPPPHIHDREDEIFYILRGKAKILVADEEFEISAGDIMYLPRGLAHVPIPLTDDLEALVIVTPSDFLGYFRRFGSRAKYPGKPEVEDAPPADIAEMLRVGGEFGVTYLPPGAAVSSWPVPHIHAKPKHVVKGHGEELKVMGSKVTVKLDGQDTQNLISIFEIEDPAGTTAPRHIHHFDSEAIFVLEGAYEIEIDGRTHRALPGTFIYIPRGATRRYRNYAAAPAKMLVLTAKSGHEAFFRQINEMSVMDSEKLAIISRRNGLELVD